MMSKKIIYGLLVLCCCSVFLLVGCSKKADTTTTKTTPRTPVQLVNDRVNASDAINGRQDVNIQDLATRVGVLEGRPIIDLSSLNTRVLALEGLNNSAVEAINASLSYRIALIEAKLVATPTPTATPSPNSSTPTPTPSNGNHAPIIHDILYDNFSECPYYAVLFCNASDADNDILTFNWFSNTSFINNGNARVYWIPPYVGWNGSTLNISVIVTDGKGGNVSYTRPISH